MDVAKWFNGVKWKTSSFVPDDMTRLEYVKSVKEAYYNLIRDIKPLHGVDFKLIGESNNRIRFEMIVEKKKRNNDLCVSTYN
ncbi:hypothetical protein HN446_01665 [bacterium]|jgi:hypothetical protein|nr:hypothetical protein [bacterium]